MANRHNLVKKRTLLEDYSNVIIVERVPCIIRRRIFEAGTGGGGYVNHL